jgi:DnaJ-class molecular chaperone
MKSPYDILGIARTATPEQIRTAYRRLAKANHPDTNPDKPDAAEQFAAISAAHALLSDPDKRARFDRGEIDATGAEARPRHSWRDFVDDPQAQGFGGGGFDDLLHQAMGGGRRRGADLRFTATIPFLDAARGTTRRLTLPDGQALDLAIPAGTETGQVLRLRGRGQAGPPGAPPGDALVTVTVTPHRHFRREGNDILLDLPVTLAEAVLGAKVEVPTLTGKVTLAIPPNSGPGTRLRLRGLGIQAGGINSGHQFVILALALPPGGDPALAEFLRSWTPAQPHNPRADLDA